jgi:hypothetical protein
MKKRLAKKAAKIIGCRHGMNETTLKDWQEWVLDEAQGFSRSYRKLLKELDEFLTIETEYGYNPNCQW